MVPDKGAKCTHTFSPTFESRCGARRAPWHRGGRKVTGGSVGFHVAVFLGEVFLWDREPRTCVCEGE